MKFIFMLAGILCWLPARGQKNSRENPDLSLSGLFSAAWFSQEDHLNFGGHDPNSHGFNVQNIELTLAHSVDPYLTAEAHIISLLEKGESIFELEEVFFSTSSLPGSLSLSGGQYFTRIGRMNWRHPHSWNFADQAIILNRMYGDDGLRNPGASLTWLAPLPLYLELTASVQQSDGVTAFSFLGDNGGTGHGHGHEEEESSETPGEEDHAEGLGGYEIIDKDQEKFRDLLYHTRAELSFDISSTLTLLAGGDFLTGPNNKGPDNRTYIGSGDLYLKWKPEKARLGYPYLSWQTEYIYRVYEAGLSRTELKDKGFYSELMLGFIERWALGLRGEYANGSEGELGPLREERMRLSWNINFAPSEYSRIRLQHNSDFTHDKTIQAVFLQVEFNIGAHGAHVF